MAVLGGAQAVAGHMGQVSAANAQNRNRAKMQKHQQMQVHGRHLSNITGYYLRNVDAQIQKSENLQAASRAWAENELVRRQAISKYVDVATDNSIKAMTDQRLGKAAERGNTRVMRSILASAGRKNAQAKSIVTREFERRRLSDRNITLQYNAANRKAWRQIGQPPKRGAMPPDYTPVRGPSMFSLIANTAMGAAQGYMMGKQFEAMKLKNPGGGGGGGTTNTNSTKNFNFNFSLSGVRS